MYRIASSKIKKADERGKRKKKMSQPLRKIAKKKLESKAPNDANAMCDPPDIKMKEM